MFSLFRKKPTRDESLAWCMNLARKAEITPIMEEGLSKGFVILIDLSNGPMEKYCGSNESFGAFIGVVEKRITNRDYEDPRYSLYGGPPVDPISGIRYYEDLVPLATGGVRIVITDSYDPSSIVFRWGE
ncbi:MAG: hypothetical protein HQL78_05580 [Magnetococcales bacterium]|nr:hypothetical protein [Magnetococcales bacterium]